MREGLPTLGFILLVGAAMALLVFSDATFALHLAASMGFPGFVLLASDHIMTNFDAPDEDENWMLDNWRRTGDPCNFGLTSDWMDSHWDN